MLQIARHTDYAARIVLHLACLEAGAQVSIAGIAQQRQLPAYFVRRLIGRLVKEGILASSRGSNGGIRLARPAGTITLLDVVRAMEGPIVLNLCLEPGHTCPFAADCPVQSVWIGATRALESALSAATFADLAAGPAGHRDAHLQLSKPVH
jgi:Rrf2 family protein